MNPPSDLDIYVLAGQSNMQGCGLLRGALESDERVWSFSSAGQWEIAREPLHRLWESFAPVHQNFMRAGVAGTHTDLSDAEMAEQENRTRITGAGLGLSFGRAIADATSRPVGLIPAAHGGTSLEDWNFNRKDQGGDSLYGAMLERIRRAGGNLRAVLWYQGESDSLEVEAPTYGERLTQWIEALRADLGRPDLPFLAIQIGRVVENPHPSEENRFWKVEPWQQVREALRVLPAKVPQTAVTSAIDLGLDDHIHIDTSGLIRLGRRMAHLMANLEDSSFDSGALQLARVERAQGFNGMGMVRISCRGVKGGWQACDNIGGFEIRDAQNQPHRDFFVINASVDGDDSSAINLLLNAPPDDSALVSYGMGLNPFCNAVDEADMPLCAFAPQPVAL